MCLCSVFLFWTKRSMESECHCAIRNTFIGHLPFVFPESPAHHLCQMFLVLTWRRGTHSHDHDAHTTPYVLPNEVVIKEWKGDATVWRNESACTRTNVTATLVHMYLLLPRVRITHVHVHVSHSDRMLARANACMRVSVHRLSRYNFEVGRSSRVSRACVTNSFGLLLLMYWCGWVGVQIYTLL